MGKELATRLLRAWRMVVVDRDPSNKSDKQRTPELRWKKR